MGRLLVVSPCPVCNYYLEDHLHFGGSSRSRLFIDHRYVLAHCHDCNHIVSVLIKTPDYDIPVVLQAARDDLAVLEQRAASGDVLARQLLPLHRAALDASAAESDDFDEAPGLEVCTYCGSGHLTLLLNAGGDDGELFDSGHGWLQCPRCEEGRLLVQTAGYWDEIDQAG